MPTVDNMPTAAMAFGSAFHSYILEPESFEDEFVSMPETYVNDKEEVKPWNMNAKICKEKYAEIMSCGKQLLPKTTPAKDKSIPINPIRIRRVVPQKVAPQHFSNICHSHRCPRMSGVRGLDGVHAERTDRVG